MKIKGKLMIGGTKNMGELPVRVLKRAEKLADKISINS